MELLCWDLFIYNTTTFTMQVTLDGITIRTIDQSNVYLVEWRQLECIRTISHQNNSIVIEYVLGGVVSQLELHFEDAIERSRILGILMLLALQCNHAVTFHRLK